jgi:hypothetical protein
MQKNHARKVYFKDCSNVKRLPTTLIFFDFVDCLFQICATVPATLSNLLAIFKRCLPTPNVGD